MNCAIHTDVPAAAFCRTCGKALCENCKRDVMGAIYCEPCIAARLQGAAPGVPTAVPVTVVHGAPSPGLAGLLGMIPGVGAMYNGQFVKAFIHVVIFAMLIVAVDHARSLEPLFGLMIGAFWFYMVIEAYKTARARELGLPAPDPLGLDRIFGIQEHEPISARTASSAEAVQSQGSSEAGLRHHPPTGAIVLVALGVFFLLDNFGMLHATRMWPLMLIGFGLWIAFQRTTGRG
jgi:hypothetical protein